jgi:hypothetical protein
MCGSPSFLTVIGWTPFRISIPRALPLHVAIHSAIAAEGRNVFVFHNLMVGIDGVAAPGPRETRQYDKNSKSSAIDLLKTGRG